MLLRNKRRTVFFKSNSRNMTAGSPLKLIVHFGIPLMISSVFQQIYSITDAIILGREIGSAGLAVIGIVGWPIWLQISFITNFSQAASMITATCFGAAKPEDLKKSVGNISILSAVTCVFLIVGLQLLVDPLLSVLNTPEEILLQVRNYLRITYAGTIFLFVYNVPAAFLRAIGDGKTPLYAILISSGINILLDLLFVKGKGWGTSSAAAATLTAQFIAMIVCLIKLTGYKELKPDRRHFHLSLPFIGNFLKLCVPMLIQSLVLALGGLFVQSRVNIYGKEFVAGISASGRVFDILEIGGISLAQATSVFVAQNYGALNFRRVRQGVKSSVYFSFGAAALLACLMILFGKTILSFFVEIESLGIACGHLMVTSFGLLIMYPMYVLRQTLHALSNSVISLIAAIVQLLTRVFVALFFPVWFGPEGLFFATVSAWLTSFVITGVAYPKWIKHCIRGAGEHALQ